MLHHKVIKQTIVVGDPRREIRYKQAQSGAISNMNDLLAGRTKIKESVLPAAIKESTQMLMDTASELSFSEQGIMAVDKDNPNYVTLLNSSGLGVGIKDGGQTFHNAITRGQINADLITAGSINADYTRTGSLNADLITTGSLNADLITTGSLNADYIRGGTLDANLVNVVGGDSDKYITMKNDEISLYGTYTRTFRGVTETDSTFTRFKHGHLRFRNNNKDRSLYYSDFGISTYLDGEGPDGEETSGTLVFFDYYYDSDARGTTLYSTHGKVALKSFNNGIVLDSNKNMYLGTGSDGVVKVVSEVNGDKTQTEYKPILASAFQYGSSERFKRDIVPWETNATETIKNLKIYEYNLKGEINDGISQNITV